eukprot:Protomagalhaensia_wolfi_Nauph_80__4986@NODE_526_length_2377_cov_91_926433_g392_i0_p2_GENE_NODE_526_length_2377_cov_91_926433_g392_i0NODE_526_length_2377_cov_91_926433_g392_i0_p2_ORF_typecomplete_len212_score35_26TOBE/PF03459_17/0_019CAP/PF00188_26/0_055_NODE_526_length_2377_cov_91_926433_g392_i021656
MKFPLVCLLLLARSCSGEVECGRLTAQELIEKYGCGTVTPLETDTAAALNRLRLAAGVQPVQLNNAMQVVARIHLQAADQLQIESGCAALHSWTDGPLQIETKYNICCYPKVYDCMWDKPQEIFGQWVGFGYELSALLSRPWASGNEIMQRFRDSPDHNAVLLNTGQWKQHEWTGMGIAIENGLVFIWFTDGLKPKQFGYCTDNNSSADEE